MADQALIRKTFEEGRGVFRLYPTFVPRRFGKAGHRLKLHPDDYHAPASWLTYEPQWNSDVNSVQENVVSGEIYPRDMLVEECPEEDVDMFIMGPCDFSGAYDYENIRMWIDKGVSMISVGSEPAFMIDGSMTALGNMRRACEDSRAGNASL